MTAIAPQAVIGRSWLQFRLRAAGVGASLMPMKAVTIIVIAVAASLTSGCRDSAVIATANSSSPSGAKIASVQVQQFGGPGTAAVITSVSLADAGGKATDILVVEQRDARQDHVTVQWKGDRDLVLVVRDATVDFQAIRCAGVIIHTVTA